MAFLLGSALKAKTVLVGIGNTLRNDDGAGSVLAARLKGRVPFEVIDAGSAPENYLGKIIRQGPETVVLVDAGDFGGNPGEIRECEAGDFKTADFYATHNASLSLAAGYLREHLECDIKVILIQPQNTGFGDKLSGEVEAAVTKLEAWFYGQAKG